MKKATKRTIPAVIGVMLVLTAIFCPGCANQMFQHGWAIECRPLVAPTVGYMAGAEADAAGTAPAKAVIDQTGDLVAEYDVAYRRYDLLGWELSTDLGLKRTTNIVAASELAPASAVDSGHGWKTVHAPTNPVSMLPPGSSLDFIHQWDQDTQEFRYPRTECVFLTGDGIFWYVPPAEQGQEPRMILIEGDQENTSWYVWPARVVCYPFVLVGDMLIWPPTMLAVWLGWAEPP